MTINVQTCWNGHRFLFRALICGGLRVSNDDPEDSKWRRATASKMLDLLEAEGFERRNIRFRHL